MARAALIAALACAPAPTEREPRAAFWTAVKQLCGRSFEGRVTEASPADSGLVGPQLVLNVWQCYAGEVRLAFHVGDDHSRVWLLSPTETGLRLEHEMHAADGSPLPYSGYGGETRTPGTAHAQVFRPDDEILARLPAAAATEWGLELRPGGAFAYSVRSPGQAGFRVEFDLSRSATRPPSPWGYTRVRQEPALDTTGRPRR